MEFTVEPVQAGVPVTIIALHGELDASNFSDLIAKARDLHAAGVRRILLDLGDLSFMSSSGIVALHSMIKLMRGDEPTDPDSGWEAYHTIDRDRGAGVQPYIKLLNPQPKILRSLEMSGMSEFFEIFTDRQTALGSF